MQKIVIEQTTKLGRIFGASSAIGQRNVTKRIELFDRLRPIAGADFIDLGCGEGGYSQALARAATRRIVLVDILESNIASARSIETPEIEWEYRVAPAEATGLADATFDRAFLIEVLDHVDDPSAVLREAHRLLRPGGALYLSVPNRMFPFETHPIRWNGGYVSPRYLPFLPWVRPLHDRLATAAVFTAGQLRRLGSEAGFADVRCDYMMSPAERSGSRLVQRLFEVAGETPLKIFGVSICAVMVKA